MQQTVLQCQNSLHDCIRVRCPQECCSRAAQCQDNGARCLPLGTIAAPHLLQLHAAQLGLLIVLTATLGVWAVPVACRCLFSDLFRQVRKHLF